MNTASGPEDAAIVASGLTKAYGKQRAVDDLTFDVPWGRVTGFLGPNGAGKSTTLRMILGLTKPSAGSSFIAGQPVGHLGDPALIVGALLETQQFNPLRSAEDHLSIYASVSRLPRRRVEEVLNLVDLHEARKKKVGRYSLGMRQRLGLATALLADPRILILDEPANGLDPSGIRWLRRFIRGFTSEGRAVFVSSHQLGEISQMADEVIVIDRGRLIVHAPVTELTSRVENRTRVRTDEPERLRERLAAAGFAGELTSHDSLLVQANAEQVGRIAAHNGVTILELGTQESSLEDIFLDLIGTEGPR